MLPLLFIILITGLSVLVSTLVSPKATWFEYYRGGIIGFFLSAVILHLWNKRRRKKEMEQEKR